MRRFHLSWDLLTNPILAGISLFVMATFLSADPLFCVAVAQEFTDEIEPEEEEPAKDASPSELLGELEEQRQELQKNLSDPDQDKSLIESAIQQLDEEIASLQKIAELRQQLEKAEDGGDQDKLEQLEQQVEGVVEQFERLRQLGEVEAGLREATFELREARREMNRSAVRQLPRIIAAWQELLSLVKRLHQIYEDGPEELEEPLEIGVEMSERIVFLQGLLLEQQSKRPKELPLRDVDREKQIVALVKLHEAFMTTGKQLLEAYEKEDEANVELLEERIGDIERRLQPAWKLFSLTRELQEAREQGNAEAVNELKSELASLRDKTTPPPAGPDSESKEMPLPVTITDADRAAAARLNFQEAIFPLLKTHCVRCHGTESQEGDLDLDKAVTELPLVRNSRLWTSVAEHVKNRVMPPEDENQPSDTERRTIAAWILGEIQNFDYSQIKDPGYEPARRLTHQEYSNTVRDLLGMALQITDKFPIDLSGTSGFDNSANTLFIQPLLLERYLAAADAVVRQALPEEITTPQQRETWRRIFVASADSEGSERDAAGKILSLFLSRVYRRPATPQELSHALKQFQTARKTGVRFEASIKNVVRASLVSPKFLMKIETSRSTDQAYPIDNWELANRLSYFLWASMPDDELFRLAKENKLSDPAILASQVNRMLSVPPADTLGTIFAAQWLGFQHLGTRVRADPIDNPWCTDSLMDAMKAESAMFFTALIRENQPLQQLVDAKYTFLNEELAKHYRLPGVKGQQMRRVELSTINRGGIFTQGSLLAVTSFPGRTSPVVRGKWILEDVLGTPPPPPPPNVSEFSEEIGRRRALTRREKLELHRQKPNCYACHSQIDPLGFSLANYDWFGRFKARSRRRMIDASGQLPDGTEFSGPAGLKKIIVEKRMSDLTRQITRKMLSYALGRQLEYYDESAVRKIIAAVETDGHRFQTLVHEIVESYPFRYKKHSVDHTSDLSPKTSVGSQ